MFPVNPCADYCCPTLLVAGGEKLHRFLDLICINIPSITLLFGTLLFFLSSHSRFVPLLAFLVFPTGIAIMSVQTVSMKPFTDQKPGTYAPQLSIMQFLTQWITSSCHTPWLTFLQLRTSQKGHSLPTTSLQRGLRHQHPPFNSRRCRRKLLGHWRRWPLLQSRGHAVDCKNWRSIRRKETSDRAKRYTEHTCCKPCYSKTRGHWRHPPYCQP